VGRRADPLARDSATHRAIVWVGETRIAEHEGGYTPFEADITDQVELGGQNRITVVVSNILNWQSIPPGRVEQTPDGPRQRYFHDFYNYAGLHRTVWLYTRPAVHICDITIVTALDGATGTVRYVVETTGADGMAVRVVMRDADGVEVARAEGSSGELTIDRVHPWRPREGLRARRDTGRRYMTDLFDVIMLNRYYGWYVQAGDLAAAERALEAELHAWAQKYDKPIIMTEYGADTFSGLHDVLGTTWTEEYQTEVLNMCHRVFDRVEAVVGEQIWNFADFATGPGVLRVDGNKKGVFTRERRPKASAHLLRRPWRRGP
jgi:beta-galactosidase/beta-glucuronidase